MKIRKRPVLQSGDLRTLALKIIIIIKNLKKMLVGFDTVVVFVVFLFLFLIIIYL